MAVAKVNISADALRMRCRRLCEMKPSGKCAVNETTASQYRGGGEGRELLEMALLEALARHGTSRKSYKKIKARKPCIYIYIYITHSAWAM